MPQTAAKPYVPSEEERQRVRFGWQCPECYGADTNPRYSRFQASPIGFSCRGWSLPQC